MDLINIAFGGLGGAIITAGVVLYVSFSTKSKPSGAAYNLLKKLQYMLQKSEAEYYFTKSAQENYDVARLIYSHADAEIIATAFNENPEKYGESDLARGYRYGSLFTRITCNEVCPPESSCVCKANLDKILRGAKFIVLPNGESITKIDGIFCRFNDSTYLCAIAFRDPEKPERNKGIIFRDGIAEGFFEYYKQLSEKYEEFSLS